MLRFIEQNYRMEWPAPKTLSFQATAYWTLRNSLIYGRYRYDYDTDESKPTYYNLLIKKKVQSE